MEYFESKLSNDTNDINTQGNVISISTKQNTNTNKTTANKTIVEITCEGCQLGSLGQRAHMDIGGCLEDSTFSY